MQQSSVRALHRTLSCHASATNCDTHLNALQWHCSARCSAHLNANCSAHPQYAPDTCCNTHSAFIAAQLLDIAAAAMLSSAQWALHTLVAHLVAHFFAHLVTHHVAHLVANPCCTVSVYNSTQPWFIQQNYNREHNYVLIQSFKEALHYWMLILHFMWLLSIRLIAVCSYCIELKHHALHCIESCIALFACDWIHAIMYCASVHHSVPISSLKCAVSVYCSVQCTLCRMQCMM